MGVRRVGQSGKQRGHSHHLVRQSRCRTNTLQRACETEGKGDCAPWSWKPWSMRWLVNLWKSTQFTPPRAPISHPHSCASTASGQKKDVLVRPEESRRRPSRRGRLSGGIGHCPGMPTLARGHADVSLRFALSGAEVMRLFPLDVHLSSRFRQALKHRHDLVHSCIQWL